MSHFACIVIGDDIEKQLQPYHEFECTGINDEYVQDIDITEEVRKEYATETRLYIRTPEGDMIPYYSKKTESFWRDLTATEEENFKADKLSGSIRINPDSNKKGHQIFELPAGYKKVEIPTSCCASFLEFAKEYVPNYVIKDGDQLPADDADKWKYGYVVVDKDDPEQVIKIVNRTNPNKKWDWWVVGGRWRGYFKLKPGCPGTLGEQSIFAVLRNEDENMPGRADCARKCDIDWDGMKQDVVDAASKRFDEIAAIAPIDWESLKSIREREPDITKARSIYYAQPSIKKLCNAKTFIANMDSFLVGRDAYIAEAAKYATMPFAFVKDGKWFERGRMGYWAVVFDENPEKQYEEWSKVFESLPDDTMMTCVDCHI